MTYSGNILLNFTLYYDAGRGCLIRSIRIVCKYRKYSFLTGVITSLTDLLQVNHQGRIGTSKTRSTGSLVHSLNSPFFPPPRGAEPGRSKRETLSSLARVQPLQGEGRKESSGTGQQAALFCSDRFAHTSVSSSPIFFRPCQVNKLTSVFYASVLLLIMNFVITLSK